MMMMIVENDSLTCTCTLSEGSKEHNERAIDQKVEQ